VVAAKKLWETFMVMPDGKEFKSMELLAARSIQGVEELTGTGAGPGTRRGPLDLAGGRQRIIVLGVGNLLLGDEGAGVHVVQQLRLTGVPPGVELIDGGTAGFSLLPYFDGADLVVIIDAASDGKPAGTITELRPHFGKDYPPTLTAHDVGLKNLVDALALAETRPDIVLFTISVSEPERATIELSAPIDRAIRETAERVRAFLSGR
jgi:hydrogenase maturation protease